MIVAPYAGPGGMSEGLRALGLADIGIELDPAACATRNAAGHRTVRADATTYPLDHLAGKVDGLVATPPCQAFSTAGNGAGREVLDELAAVIARGDWSGHVHDDERVRHVLEVGRWAETLRPRWVVCEQVPPVLPLWRAYAARWHALGWSAWAGVLNAADFGVPQTRRRAFLIARTDGVTAVPPEPTHCEGGASTMFGALAPWVSMADALGWDEAWGTGHETARGSGMRDRHGARRVPRATEPSQTVTSKARSWTLDRRQQHDGEPVRIVGCDTEPAPTLTGNQRWVFHRPATTVAGDPRITARCHHDEGSQGANAVTVEQAMTGDYDGTAPIKLTVRDALILQGFPEDYPVQGTRTAQFRQVGDAVPPPLAAAVIGTVAGTAQENAA